MCISSIKLTLPFCGKSKEKQTKCSLILRTMAVGLGAIALLIGILILCDIQSLSMLGTTGGSLFSALGAVMLLTGAFLHCIKKSDQQSSEHSTKISHTHPESQGNSQKVTDDVQDMAKTKSFSFYHMNSQNKTDPINFAKITPENYEKHIEVTQKYNFQTPNKGNFVFKKCAHKDDFTPPKNSKSILNWKKGDIYLIGIIFIEDGYYDGGGLEIKNGQFIHYPQMAAPAEHFSNLKDFFDYLFRGNFYQGEYIKDMDFFALKTIHGEEVRYYNPYKN